MFPRIHLGAAGAVLTLAAVPLGALSAQTPSNPPTSGRTPPINPPVIQNAPQPTATTPNASGANPGGANPGGASRAEVAADSLFIRDAVTGNSLEIRLGEIARTKASDGGVKSFARKMVTDHTKMRDQWRELAGRNGVNTSLSLDASAEAAANQMATLSGAEFDRAYLSEMVSAHQADITKFQQASQSADAPDVRQIASSALPIMQSHLSDAQRLSEKVGGTGVASGSPSPADSDRTQRDRSANNRNVDAADRQYVNEVAVGHLMEVRLAEMAQRQAKDGDVKRLANRLHDDFSRYLSRWTDLNGREPHMGKLHQEKITRLQKANGKQFDRTYVDIVVENINSMIPYFEKEGRDAKTAKVRNLVNDELATLRENLQAARRIDRQALSSSK